MRYPPAVFRATWPRSEKITVAVRPDDLLEGDTANPERHPIAIAVVGKTMSMTHA